MVKPGHNMGNSQVSVNRTIGPTLVTSVFQVCSGDSTTPIVIDEHYKSINRIVFVFY